MPHHILPQAPQRNVDTQPPQSSSFVGTSTENTPFHAQPAGPHPSSSRLGSLHTTRTFVAPSHPTSRQDARQEVQYLNAPSSTVQRQNQARQFAPMHATELPIPPRLMPTRDMHRFSEAVPIPAGTLHHTQRQSGTHSMYPISGTNAACNVRPNRVVPSADSTSGGHDLVLPRQGTIDQISQTIDHGPRSHPYPRIPASHPEVTHHRQVALEDRTMSQSETPTHTDPPQCALPPVPQRQPGIGVTQGPPNGAGNLHLEHPRQSMPSSNDTVFRAADSHATFILNATYSSLNVFYETQKRILRDELLRMNAQRFRIDQQAKEACRRALRAEQEAKEKQEAAVRASESIVSKAMEWKESLEDSRRKHAIVQQQNAKLAQIALHLNKVVATNPSAEQVAALKNRVTHLEARLKQYEDVPPSIEAQSPALDDSFGYVPSSSMLSAQGTPSPSETDAANSSRSDADKQRQKIVTELFEGHLKTKVPEDTDTTKEEHPAVEGQERPTDASYVIDVAFDKRSQSSTHNSALSGTSEATTAASSDGLPESSVCSVSTPGVENQYPLPSDRISCVVPSSSASINSLKRELRNEDDEVDQLRKRVRCSSTSPRLSLLMGIKELDKSTRTQEKTEIGATTPSSGTHGIDNGDGQSNGDRTEKNDDETSLAKRESGMDPSYKSDSLLQIDALRLQLIYHKLESGDKACRFCVMEIDHKIRAGDAMVFPATTQNDELMAHAVAVHPSTVSHMLQMEKADILTAVARLMEVE